MRCRRFDLVCCRKPTHFPVTGPIVYTIIHLTVYGSFPDSFLHSAARPSSRTSQHFMVSYKTHHVFTQKPLLLLAWMTGTRINRIPLLSSVPLLRPRSFRKKASSLFNFFDILGIVPPS